MRAAINGGRRATWAWAMVLLLLLLALLAPAAGAYGQARPADLPADDATDIPDAGDAARDDATDLPDAGDAARDDAADLPDAGDAARDDATDLPDAGDAARDAVTNDPRLNKNEPPDPKSGAYIEEAIDELRQEYVAFAKKARGARLRPQSDYFAGKKFRLDEKQLVAALGESFGNDPRFSAYIRWQLLSGAPAQFSPDLQPKLLELYRKAPVPLPRYGLTPTDQRKLDAMLQSAKKDDYTRLGDMVAAQVEATAEANKPILAYRDELYARLAPSYDVFVAAMRDGYERLNNGMPTKAHMTKVMADLGAWAASGDAKPRQCAALAELVYKLRSERTPKYYVNVGARAGRPAYWAYRTEAMYDPKKLHELQLLLEENARPRGNARAGNGGGGGNLK